MINLNLKNKEKIIGFLDKSIILILVFLIILIPFSTFLIQLIKMFFDFMGFSPSPLLIKIIYGWKELFLSLGLVFVLIKSLINKRLPFKLIYFDIFLLFTMIIGLIYGGYLTGFRLDRIIFGFRYDFLVFLFYFLARSVSIKKEDIFKYFKIIILFSLPIIIFGLLQTFILPRGFMESFGYSLKESVTGNPLPPYHLVGETVRAMATFPGPNSLAMYLVLILFVVLFFGKQFIKNKSIYYLFFMVGFFTLLMTFSRGHIFSFLSSIIISFIFIKYLIKDRDIDKNNDRKNIFLTKSFIAGIIISVFCVLIFFGTFFISDLSKINSGGVFNVILRESSTQAHSFMRELAFDPIKQKPFGHGIGTAGLATTNISDGKFNPESFPVQIVFEYGWISLLFFYFVICGVLYILFEFINFSKESIDKKIGSFLLYSFIAIIISVNFLPSWFEATSIIWWIFFSLFISNIKFKIGRI